MVVIIIIKIIEFYFCIFQPFFSLVKCFVINALKVFEFLLNVSKVFSENGISSLFLHDEDIPHLLEFILEQVLKIFRLFPKLLLNGINLIFIWLICGSLVNDLIHFHQAFCSQVNLIEHFLLHSDIVLLVVSKESTVGAYSLFAVNANDFYWLFVNVADVIG